MNGKLPVVWGMIILLFTAISCSNNGKKVSELEQRVCGFKELFYFWLWSSAAGKPRKAEQLISDRVLDVSFQTNDGRILRGYQYISEKNIEHKHKKQFLLVLQGNAILADQLVSEFSGYSQYGYDIYIYDYRGYGRSDGKRRLKAMVNDIGEIITHLGSRYTGRNVVYAMSFGGILFIDAKYDKNIISRAVIDSTPARLSDYGCPEYYDPVENLPDNCSNYLFISGKRDYIVKPEMSADLINASVKCGAKHLSRDEFSHPFMDSSYSTHIERMKLVQEFLLN